MFKTIEICKQNYNEKQNIKLMLPLNENKFKQYIIYKIKNISVSINCVAPISYVFFTAQENYWEIWKKDWHNLKSRLFKFFLYGKI